MVPPKWWENMDVCDECERAELASVRGSPPDACEPPAADGRVVWDGQVGAWFVEGRGERIGPCPVDESDEVVTPSVLELLARTVSDLRNSERRAMSHRASIEKCQDQALVRVLTADLGRAQIGGSGARDLLATRHDRAAARGPVRGHRKGRAMNYIAVIAQWQRHRLPDVYPRPGHRLELVCRAAPASIAVDGMAPLEPQSFAFSIVGQHVTLEMMSTGYRVIAAWRSGTTGELRDD